MKKPRGVVGIVGIAAIVLLGVACSNGEAATTPQAEPDRPRLRPRQRRSLPRTLGARGPHVAVERRSPWGSPGQTVARPLPAPQPASGSETGAATASSPPVAAPEPRPAPVVVVAPVVEPQPAPDPPSWPRRQREWPLCTRRCCRPVARRSASGFTGQGSITLEPDLALVNIGVEAKARTVAEARDQAATAMAAIVAAVKAHGLTDTDIQTRSFNIWPRYDYIERTQVLAGYTVSNTASIKIRVLDNVGPIIDDVANAGGDATRINGISFTVEDPNPFMEDLRAAAVGDALAKAQHFADLTGVSLGSLIFIAEAGGRSPVVQDFGARGLAFAEAAAPPSPISGVSWSLRSESRRRSAYGKTAVLRLSRERPASRALSMCLAASSP